MRSVSLQLPRWQEAHSGLRVALLADLHTGSPRHGLKTLRKLTARTNAQRPDIVLLAGDFVIQGVLGGQFVPPEQIADVLSELKAPLGIYAVLGNHDWWFDAPRVKTALTARGIRVIDDTATVRLGVTEIQAAGQRLHVRVMIAPESALLDPESHTNGNLRRALVAAGATVHFPSIVIMRSGKVLGNAVVGHKHAAAYVAVLEPRIRSTERKSNGQKLSGEAMAHDADLLRGRGLVSRSVGAPAATPDSEPKVIWTHSVRSPLGAFFRRVPGTGFIAFEQRRKVSLLNLNTGERFLAPGWIDFVPTPDGRIFVTPARAKRGLEFYLADDVFRAGRSGKVDRIAPVLLDRDMTDQYPSVGILEKSEDGGAARYRVLTSWFQGLVFRDYEAGWTGHGSVRIRPISQKRRACGGMALSTPMLSKDGQEFAARDEVAGSTRLFRLNGDGSCTELLNLGRQTSKVGFSSDGTLVAYSAPDFTADSQGTRSATYVLNRRTMRTSAIPYSQSSRLVIPEIVGTDSILIAVTVDALSDLVEFRLICCVR